MRSLRIGASSSSAAIRAGEAKVDAAVGERRGHPRVPHLLGQELDVRVAGPKARPSAGSVSKRVLQE